MNKIFADRLDNLKMEGAFKVLSKAQKLERAGRDIIHLEIGEPDFDTPKNIIEKAVYAMENGYTHYTEATGMLSAKEAVVEYAKKFKHLDINTREVVITPGAKPVMFYTLLALVNKGDEVIYPDPGYPVYRSLINFVGAKGVAMSLKEENDFRVDIETLKNKINDKTKLIILNNPQNPTGGILYREDLEKIADLIRDKNIFVLSDEIYERITYREEDDDLVSMANIDGMKEKTIILDGLSKTYSMTGFRIGYGIMPEKIRDKMELLMVNSVSNTATFTQYALIEALRGDQTSVDLMVDEFKKRRDFIVDGLNSIDKISCKKPRGAFYVFPNIKKTEKSSKELADYILEEAGVSLLDGSNFGKEGEGYLRLSYATSMENIKEALDRIEKAIKKL